MSGSHRLPVVDEDQQTIRPSSSNPAVKPAVHFVPYSDEPPPSPENDVEPSQMIEQQRLIMEGESFMLSMLLIAHISNFPKEQDTRLDRLSESVGRQRDISIHINDELTVHNGLLDELGHDVDDTHDRLSRARRKLETFSRGVKGNCKSANFLSVLAK